MKKIPFGLIPITDNTINLYNYEVEKDVIQYFEDGNDIEEEIIKEIENEQIGFNDYKSYIKNSLDNLKGLKQKTGVGYIEDNYNGRYMRNCIIEGSTCEGINDEYMYDDRKTRDKLTLSKIKINHKNEEYSEFETVIDHEKLNIVGFLEEPIDKLFLSYSWELNFSLYEKFIINKLINNNLVNLKNKFKNINILEKVLENSSLNNTIEKNIYQKFNLTESYTKQQIYELLESKLIKKNDIINHIFNDKLLNDIILNHKDLENLIKKYRLTYSDFDVKERILISKKISENIKKYRKNYHKKVKIKKIKKLKIKKPKLSDELRVELSKNYILSLFKEEIKNYYLKKFIKSFSRKSDKQSEDSNFLYNKYTDKKLLCRHYEYSTEITNNNDKFTQMKDIFGLPPKDGIIFCKVCGEELCLEDFSLFDGFDSDDKPIQSTEKLMTESLILKENMINEYLEKKELTCNLINDIMSSININLDNKNIYDNHQKSRIYR